MISVSGVRRAGTAGRIAGAPGWSTRARDSRRSALIRQIGSIFRILTGRRCALPPYLVGQTLQWRRVGENQIDIGMRELFKVLAPN